MRKGFKSINSHLTHYYGCFFSFKIDYHCKATNPARPVSLRTMAMPVGTMGGNKILQTLCLCRKCLFLMAPHQLTHNLSSVSPLNLLTLPLFFDSRCVITTHVDQDSNKKCRYHWNFVWGLVMWAAEFEPTIIHWLGFINQNTPVTLPRFSLRPEKEIVRWRKVAVIEDSTPVLMEWF